LLNLCKDGPTHLKRTQMIRQPEREQLNRLTVKTLDQVFIMMRGKEGLGCSQFEAEALTNLVKEVYFPWLSQPLAIQAGQLAMTTVSADEPGHKPLSKCKIVSVILTLYAGEEDHRYRLSRKGAQGTVALRRRQIVRIAHEALDRSSRYETKSCTTASLSVGSFCRRSVI